MSAPAKVALALLLAGFALPFIFFQDFYPFYRFGMFAETPRPGPHEVFEVRVKSDSGWEILPPEEMGFTYSNWQALLRNHHYRKQDALFIEKLKQSRQEAADYAVFKIRVGVDTVQIGFP